MLIKFNGTEPAEYPSKFTVTTLDLDSSDSVRTSDGTLVRDRVAVKRQIEAEWGLLDWADISSILQSMGAVSFSIYYPDPYTGSYETKQFMAGNRPALLAVEIMGILKWSGLKITFTEI